MVAVFRTDQALSIFPSSVSPWDAHGRLGGRKPSLDVKQINEIKVLLRDPSVNVTDIAKIY